MHLRASIKRLAEDHYLAIAKFLIVVASPLLALVCLALFGVLLGKHNLDPEFGSVSSFIEVMIALDASCSFKAIGKWLKGKREQHLGEMLKDTHGRYGAIEELSLSDKQRERLSLVSVCDRLDGYVQNVGLMFSFLLSCWLIVGIKGYEPCAVFAAFPLLAYIFSIVAANKLVEVSYASILKEGMSPLPPPPTDDRSIIASAMGCTGPVLNEENNHE